MTITAKSRGAPAANAWLALGVTILALTAIFFGLIAALTPYWLVISLFAIPVFVIVLWLYPEVALGLVVLLLTGLVPPHLVPTLPFLGGRINASDLFVLLLALSVPLRLRADFVRAYPYAKRLLWSAAFILAAVFFSSAIAILFLKTDPKAVLAEARLLGYWAIVFVAVPCFADPVRTRRFMTVLLVIAVLVALGQIVQALLGIQVFASGRLEVAETLGMKYTGVYRSVTPGIMVIVFALLFSGAMALNRGRYTIFWVGISAVLFLGLLFTYGRTLWAVTALGFVVLAWLSGFRKFLPLLVVAVVGASIAIGALAVAKPEAVTAVYDRVLSVDSEVSRGASLRWRYLENEYALAALVRNPLIGVGMGGDYKPYLSSELLPEQTRHIHNGHLYLALKVGLVGALIFLMSIGGIVMKAIFSLKRFCEISSSASSLAYTAASFAVLPFISALTRPEWLDASSVAMFSISIAVISVTPLWKAK